MLGKRGVPAAVWPELVGSVIDYLLLKFSIEQLLITPIERISKIGSRGFFQ